MKKTIIFDFYKTIYNPDTDNLYRGIRPILTLLRKSYNLCLVTTGGKKRRSLIQRLRIGTCFSEVMVCPKKTKKIFGDIARNSDQVMVIGDRDDEELRIAKALKLPFIKIDTSKSNPANTIRKELLKYGTI